MSAFTLLQGDCRKVLATLPDESVHCCISSPPYWGLRDYQTAEWEGGDTECDHLGKPHRTRSGFNERYSGIAASEDNKQDALTYPMGNVCDKCGARRIDSQLGLEETPVAYVENMVAVFRAVRRVLRDDGTLWLNLGDSYTSGNRADRDPALVSSSSGLTNRSNGLDRARTPVGLKPKDLVGIPWRVAFALQADGWYLRQDIIWAKPNPMPESVTDRCTKSHEYIFLLTKSARYYYDNEAVKEPQICSDPRLIKSGIVRSREYGYSTKENELRTGNRKYDDVPINYAGNGTNVKGHKGNSMNTLDGKRNKRSVWTVTTKPFKGAHFATFPPDLIEPCVLAGTSEKGCCEKCGKPWERVTIKDIEQPDGYGNMGANDGKWQGENKQSSGHRIQKNMNALRAAGRNHDNPFPTKTTTGWRSTCECGGEPVQCVVLDPFSGAGTTGVVAVQRGRCYIGIELNPEYLEMSRKRIQQAWEGITLPLFG